MVTKLYFFIKNIKTQQMAVYQNGSFNPDSADMSTQR